MRCALVGDNLASFGIENGWSGVVVYGCVRDAADLLAMEFGVKALGTCPVKGIAADPGVRDVPVSFAGVTIMPGNFIYSDLDGIIVSNTDLLKT